jgi:hypothetical protein
VERLEANALDSRGFAQATGGAHLYVEGNFFAVSEEAEAQQNGVKVNGSRNGIDPDLSDAEWRTSVPHDGRKIGVVARRVGQRAADVGLVATPARSSVHRMIGTMTWR